MYSTLNGFCENTTALTISVKHHKPATLKKVVIVDPERAQRLATDEFPLVSLSHELQLMSFR